jgi:hypothetical protein
LDLKIPITIHNKFEIEIKNAESGDVTQKAIAYNVVLDQYFSNLINNAATPLGYISIGRGTGVLSTSRTGLFNQITSRAATIVTVAKAYPTSYTKRKVVFNPEEYVGEVITEVGFTGATHAMLQDSEGNPISITKTDTDILTVYATFYCTLPSSIFDGRATWGTVDDNAFLAWIIDDSYTGISTSNSGPSIGLSDVLEPTTVAAFSNGNSIASSVSMVGWTSWVRDIANKKITIPVKRLDVNTGNGFIKAIKFVGTSGKTMFILRLPHAASFGGMSFTGVSLGTGDGARTDFDIKVPIVKANTEAIKVNGVTKTKDIDYTIDYNTRYGESISSGKGYMSRRNIAAGYIYTELEVGGGSFSPGNQANVYPTANEAMFQWDFETPVVIDAVMAFAYNSSWILGCMKVLGSNDGVNWDTVATISNITDNGSCVNAWTTVKFNNTTAYRFYRWGGSNSLTNCDANSITKGLKLLFGKKAIHFITPPVNGAAITADCQTDYILKNTNYVMDIGLSIQLGRG